MKNLVIVGTSGVGKTFLEGELEKRKMYFRVPIYSDRNSRPGEDKKTIVCISREEFIKRKSGFIFFIGYAGFNYAWKESDLEKKLAVIDIGFKDLERFLVKFPEYTPLMMDIGEDKLPFLRERMEKRGDSQENIEKRIKLTIMELRKIEEYRNVVKKYNGLIFQIKNDKTIFEEVIPALIKRLSPR